MKDDLLVLRGLLVTFCASTGHITLNTPGGQKFLGGKRLCIYTISAAGTFTYITQSKKCAAVKSFGTSQAI